MPPPRAGTEPGGGGAPARGSRAEGAARTLTLPQPVLEIRVAPPLAVEIDAVADEESPAEARGDGAGLTHHHGARRRGEGPAAPALRKAGAELRRHLGASGRRERTPPHFRYVISLRRRAASPVPVGLRGPRRMRERRRALRVPSRALLRIPQGRGRRAGRSGRGTVRTETAQDGTPLYSSVFIKKNQLFFFFFT